MLENTRRGAGAVQSHYFGYRSLAARARRTLSMLARMVKVRVDWLETEVEPEREEVFDRPPHGLQRPPGRPVGRADKAVDDREVKPGGGADRVLAAVSLVEGLLGHASAYVSLSRVGSARLYPRAVPARPTTLRRGERYRAALELPFAPRGVVFEVVRARLEAGGWLVELREDRASAALEPLFPRPAPHRVPLELVERLRRDGALRLVR